MKLAGRPLARRLATWAQPESSSVPRAAWRSAGGGGGGAGGSGLDRFAAWRAFHAAKTPPTKAAFARDWIYVDDPDAKHWAAIAARLQSHGLVATSGMITDQVICDQCFQDFALDAAELTLEWEFWSGYAVHARNAAAEPLLPALARLIRGHIAEHIEEPKP